MAVEIYYSKQRPVDPTSVRLYPIDKHGKTRIAMFEVAATTAVGDIGSTFELTDLPPGRVRVHPCLSRISMSAQGAARTLSVGHKAYRKTALNGGTDEALNASAFVNAMDVSGAVAAAAFSTVLKYDLYSTMGVVVYATMAGGTTPIGTTLSGFVFYTYE